jgi:PBP1b-binding outer membrane lipoprotein LpoB
MNRNTSYTLACLLAALLLGGCAGEPTISERHFGDAVRQTIRAQTYDQSTLSEPSDSSVESTDGRMLEGALDVYRTTAGNPANVVGTLSTGTGQGQ